MTGSDFRPGLETPFVWKGRKRRNWGLGFKVAVTCAVCIGAGYYVGRASMDRVQTAAGASQQTASTGSATTPNPSPIVQSASEQAGKIVQTGAHMSAAREAQPVIAVPAPQPVERSTLARSSDGAAESKAPTPAVRIINSGTEGEGADHKAAEKSEGTRDDPPTGKKLAEKKVELPPKKDLVEDKPDTPAAKPARTHSTHKKKVAADKPTTTRSTVRRDDAYASRSRTHARNDAYVPPRATGSEAADAYVPPRVPDRYARDEAYRPYGEGRYPPRMAYDPYGYEPRPPRRFGMYDDYPSDDVPRTARGYLRDFYDERGY